MRGRGPRRRRSLAAGRAPRSGLVGQARSRASSGCSAPSTGRGGVALSALGAACLLAYRGPLPAAAHDAIRPAELSPGAGARRGGRWIAAVLPLSVARAATGRGRGARRRRATLGVRRAAADRALGSGRGSCSAGALAFVWGLAAFGIGRRPRLAVLNDAVVLGAGAVALTAAAGVWAGDAGACDGRRAAADAASGAAAHRPAQPCARRPGAGGPLRGHGRRLGSTRVGAPPQRREATGDR